MEKETGNNYQKFVNCLLNKKWIAIVAVGFSIFWIIVRFGGDITNLFGKYTGDNKNAIKIAESEIRPLYFNFGSDDLRDESKSRLDYYSQLILKYNPKKIIIEAHTNEFSPETSAYVSNIPISKMRNRTVLRYLISKGIERKKIITAEYGAERPLKKGYSSYNERVELKLLW